MIEAKVGIEVEYLLLGKEKEPILIPDGWDRDEFPVLGEVRGEEAGNTPETLGNFWQAYYEAMSKIREGHEAIMVDIWRLGLKKYQEAMRKCRTQKNDLATKVRNVYGINISEFSDQIIKDRKIQGVNMSCGLHIHFSCSERVIAKYREATVYDEITIQHPDLPSLTHRLYKRIGEGLEKKVEVSTNLLTKPVVEHIVKTLDEAFFEKLAPPKGKRTKYRQPGFFELKPYGFEYRSLPANNKSMAALPEIVNLAFKLMKDLHKWD